MSVDPIQDDTVPNEAVLGVQDPVILIWKRQEFRLYPLTL